MTTNKDIDLESLKIIKNTRFSNREIDVTACLLGGRSYKKIASILSISPKTVEHHARNIMLRIGCNSREGIIDFVEKSDKLSLVRAHYATLLIKATFEQELKNLSPITKENNINCLIFHYEMPVTKTSFIFQLEQNLNIAGIKTFSKTWVKNKSEGFLVNKIGAKQVNCIFYVLSGTFIEQLKASDYKIHEEASNLIPLIKESSFPVVFLLLDDKVSLDVNENQANFSYIKLSESKSYYFLFFDLLKKILPSSNIETNIARFKNQYEMFHGNSALQEQPKNSNLVVESNDINNDRKKKKSFFKWAILFFIFFIGFSFAAYKINKKNNNFPTYQSQNIKSKTDSNKQNDSELYGKQNSLLQIKNQLVNNYYVRKQLVEDLTKKLNKQGIIAITGIAGSGKTQLAYYYAYNVFHEKYPASIISTISCDTINKLRKTYREFAINCLNMPENIGIDDYSEVKEYVKKKLQSKQSKNKYLLIFDNVDTLSLGDIKDYLPGKLSAKQQIIITSQKSNFFGPNDTRNFRIGGFTDKEAVEFLLQDSNISKKSAIEIAKEFSNLPLGLQCAKLYLMSQHNLSGREYLNLLKDQKILIDMEEEIDKLMQEYGYYENKKAGYKTQLRAIILSIKELSPEARYVLKSCSFLYSDEISHSILENLLSIKFKLTKQQAKYRFANISREYEKYSLIIPSSRKEMFSIHRAVQAAARLLINDDEKLEIVKNLLNSLDKELGIAINELGDLFYRLPDNEYVLLSREHLKEKLTMSDQLISHVGKLTKQVISNDILTNDISFDLAKFFAKTCEFGWQRRIFEDKHSRAKIAEAVLKILGKSNLKIDVIMRIRMYIFAGKQSLFLPNVGDAEKYFKKAKKILLQNIDKINDKEELIFLYTEIVWTLGGEKYSIHGRYDDAISIFEEAMSFLSKKQILEENTSIRVNINTVRLLTYYSIALIGKNDFLSARNKLKEIENNYLKQKNISYSRTLLAYIKYIAPGLIWLYQNNYNKSFDFFSKPIVSESYAAKIEMLKFCGWTKLRLGNYQKAIDFAEKALKLYAYSYGKDVLCKREVSLYILLHHAYESKGNKEKSIEYLNEVIKLRKNYCHKFYFSVYNQIPPFEWKPHYKIFKKPDNKHTKTLLSLAKKIYGDDHAEIAYYYGRLGKDYELSKKYADALSCFRQALKLLKSKSVKYNADKKNIMFLEDKIINLGKKTKNK